MSTGVRSVVTNSIKIGGPITGAVGAMSDIFSIFAPFAMVLCIGSILGVLVVYISKLHPILARGGLQTVVNTQWGRVASFLIVSAVVMGGFWGLDATTNGSGVLGAAVPSVYDLQVSLKPELEALRKGQDQIGSDVKDIKELMTGERDVKDLTSTADYDVVQKMNERADAGDRKIIAVLYFEDNSEGKALTPLKKGIADMLISDLSNVAMLRVVERARLEELLKEQKMSQTKLADPATAQQIGKMLGAEAILLGSYFGMMGTLRIDARILNVETGEVIKSEGVDGSQSDFMQLQKKLAWKLIRSLDVKYVENDLKSNEDTKVVSFEAIEAYSKGLGMYDAGDMAGAKSQMDKALKLAPNFRRAAEMRNTIASRTK